MECCQTGLLPTGPGLDRKLETSMQDRLYIHEVSGGWEEPLALENLWP